MTTVSARPELLTTCVSTLEPDRIEYLRAACGPIVAFAGEPAYEAGRAPWNAAVTQYPALVATPRNAADVARVIRAAATVGLRVAPQGTGHNAGPLQDLTETILLRTSALTGAQVDPVSGLARVGAGTLWADAVAAASRADRAVLHGSSPDVGVVGYSLGGGTGWYARQLGLQANSISAAHVVLADGSTVRADADHERDLFWALRGGGGNFGVVTRFRFQLRAVDSVLAGDVIVPATPEVLARLVEVLADAPDGLTVMPSIMAAPPMPELPEDWHGRLVVFLSFCHSGPIADDERVVELLQSLGDSRLVGIGRKPYPAMFPEPSGAREAFATGTLFVDDLDDAAIGIIQRRMASPSSPEALVHMRVLGGEYARVANDATAFAHRDRRAMVWLITPFADSAEAPRHEAWTADFEAELRAAGSGSGAFSNFLGRDGEAELHAAYPPGTLARLAEVKVRYDPANLFRSNLNIPPAT